MSQDAAKATVYKKILAAITIRLTELINYKCCKKNFVEEWSRYFKLNECNKTSNLNYKTMQRKSQLNSLKPAFLPSLLVGEWNSDSDSLINLSSLQQGGFHLFQCNIPDATPPRRLPKTLWVKEVKVEAALLADPARYPHLTHLTLSSDELLLSSSTATMIS